MAPAAHEQVWIEVTARNSRVQSDEEAGLGSASLHHLEARDKKTCDLSALTDARRRPEEKFQLQRWDCLSAVVGGMWYVVWVLG